MNLNESLKSNWDHTKANRLSTEPTFEGLLDKISSMTDNILVDTLTPRSRAKKLVT